MVSQAPVSHSRVRLHLCPPAPPTPQVLPCAKRQAHNWCDIQCRGGKGMDRWQLGSCGFCMGPLLVSWFNLDQTVPQLGMEWPAYAPQRQGSACTSRGGSGSHLFIWKPI